MSGAEPIAIANSAGTADEAGVGDADGVAVAAGVGLADQMGDGDATLGEALGEALLVTFGAPHDATTTATAAATTKPRARIPMPWRCHRRMFWLTLGPIIFVPSSSAT
jgi:hypothetical protein